MSYLPDVYQEFRQEYPDITASYEDLAGKCHEWGPLDEKTRRLIKLGIAMGMNSEGGVRSHARRALEEGLSVEEIHHAVMLAFTITGFPMMIAAMKWVDEVIKNEVTV